MEEFVENKDSVLIFASFDKNEIDRFCKEYEDVKLVVLRE
jgi:glycerophosphoryl diester phosphodiesterase